VIWPKLFYRLFFNLMGAKLRTLGLTLICFSGILFFVVLYRNIGLKSGLLGLVFAIICFKAALVGWDQWKTRRHKLKASDLTSRTRSNSSADSFTSWEDMDVTPEMRERVASAKNDKPDAELVLGHIDSDGRFWGPYGKIKSLKNISKSAFVTRLRFPVDIVLVDSIVLVRKDFRGDKKRFLKEWYILSVLGGHANVPAVHHVDEKRTVLYKNFIPGRTVRDTLFDAGAEILNVQTMQDPELAKLAQDERLKAILARGTERLGRCFHEDFFEEMEVQLDKIHQQGVARLSLTFGNVVIDRHGHPWLIDMEGAEHFSSTQSMYFAWRRDKDRKKFNQIYNRDLLTEKSARNCLREALDSSPGWYAPIDFGQGLTTGGFWSVDSGTGRWDYLNHRIMAPLIQQKRVLDLGSNNGVMPLMMLRAGAKAIVGVELDTESVKAAHLTKRLIEWKDMRKYDFRIIHGNMTEIFTADWGAFDVVTALCTLYYLTDEKMRRVIRRAAELAPLMILQANTATRHSAANRKAQKSSLSFLKNQLEQNGFPRVDVFAPKGYSRPLLVGHVI
jgi:tRNA A-37 threonylcarbamoyl transferase component Bud32